MNLASSEMDDDDCDIFADVTKFCNSNSLEEQINNAEVDATDADMHEFESNLPSSPRKQRALPKSKRSPAKVSPVKITRPKSRGKKGKAKNSEKASSSQTENPQGTAPPNAEENVHTPIASESALQELLERVNGPRLRRGRSASKCQQAQDTISTSLGHLISSLNNTNSIAPPPPAPGNSQRGRARRNYMAELAARSNVVGVVDLVTSPSLPLLNLAQVVSVESDDEALAAEIKDFDVSFDSENSEISVKVKWGENIEKFTHRKYQKFSDLMSVFATREGVAITDIVLILNDRIIQPNDTPDSLDYKIYQFISGRIIKNALCSPPTVLKKRKKLNEIEMKIQSDAWKKPISISIKKDDAFRILYIKCSEELKVPVERIKLSFDGERLDPDSTPNDLELEGEEIIDCRLKR